MERLGRSVRRRAFQLREKGFSYALIERQLGIPYAEAKQLGQEYDAVYGKPRKIRRTLAPDSTGRGPNRIPVRELRNDSAGILRQVEAGRSFLITVAGREIAEVRPLPSRPIFVPMAVVEKIIGEAPLDDRFDDDIKAALSQRVEEL